MKKTIRSETKDVALEEQLRKPQGNLQRTIAFYSYKGGIGKSTAAANFSVFLSKKGIDCVLVDLDLEAPTLHKKFNSSDSAGAGGFSRCYLSELEATFSLKENDSKLSDINLNLDAASSRRPQIEHFIKEMTFLGDREFLKGKIYLLPAGDVYNEDFWEITSGPVARAFFNLFQDYGFGRIEQLAFCKLYLYVMRIKEELSQIKLKHLSRGSGPQYIILDLRSGTLPLAVTISNMWADAIALFSQGSDEHNQYIGDFLSTISKGNLRRSGVDLLNSLDEELQKELNEIYPISKVEYDNDPVVYPVLSRIRSAGDSLVDEYENIIEHFKVEDPKKISVLHEDPKMDDMKLALHLGFNSKVVNTQLSHDYVELFGKLMIPDGCSTLKNKQIIGLPSHINIFQRIFDYNQNTGAVLNTDNKRNVAFKVETFQRLLCSIKKSISAQIVDNNETIFKSAVFQAGKNCGLSFADQMKEKWASEENDPTNRKADRIGIERRLMEWCEFDSDVGFGSFRLSSISISKNLLESCSIELVQNFLTPATDFKLEPDLAEIVNSYELIEFMRGYIYSMVFEIINDFSPGTHTIDVQHKVEATGSNVYNGEHLDSETSVFEIRSSLKEQPKN